MVGLGIGVVGQDVDRDGTRLVRVGRSSIATGASFGPDIDLDCVLALTGVVIRRGDRDRVLPIDGVRVLTSADACVDISELLLTASPQSIEQVCVSLEPSSSIVALRSTGRSEMWFEPSVGSSMTTRGRCWRALASPCRARRGSRHRWR